DGKGLVADADQPAAVALAGRAGDWFRVRDLARPAAPHAGLAVVLSQSGAALRRLGRARLMGELSVHPALPDLRRCGEDERAPCLHGRDHYRAAHLPAAMDRP